MNYLDGGKIEEFEFIGGILDGHKRSLKTQTNRGQGIFYSAVSAKTKKVYNYELINGKMRYYLINKML